MQPEDPNIPTLTPYAGNGGLQPRTRAARIGHQAAAAIDRKRGTIARGLEYAASALKTGAGRRFGKLHIAGGARIAAAAMEKSAGYVRDRDVDGMLFDARQTMKRHPGATLLTAAAVGFLLARAFSRR